MCIRAPIIGMIHNVRDQRWHPVYFLESPLPGGTGAGAELVRHKSRGHHTKGFRARAEALASANGELRKVVEQHFGTPEMCLDRDFPWDGEGIPALVVFFGKDAEGKVVPMY